jgi:putative membrane protein
MIIFLIIGLLLGAGVVIFALQNMTTIDVIFLTWHFQGSLALILVLAVVIGILISMLVSLPEMIRKSFKISNLRKHNEKLQSEISSKITEIESEKSKLAANNAYIDDVEKNPKV